MKRASAKASGQGRARTRCKAELRAKFDAASSEEERAQLSLAARYGLAALDGRDL